MAVRQAFIILLIAAVVYYFILRTEINLKQSVFMKNVVVTGANRGIGEQLAYQYAELHANLLLTARRESQLQQVAEKCRRLGASKVEIVAADMTKESDRILLVEQAEKQFGLNLDYLILNHAVFSMNLWMGTSDNFTHLQSSYETNFLSYVALASKFVKLLQANKGHIGVVSAMCGSIGCPMLAAHSASKGALHGFFSAWRQELRYQRIPVTITLCVLSLVNTEAALNEVRGKDFVFPPSQIAVTPDDAANAIIRNVALGKYYFYYPTYASLVIKIHVFWNSLVEDIFGYFVLNRINF